MLCPEHMVHYLVMEYPVKTFKIYFTIILSYNAPYKDENYATANYFCTHYIQHLGVALKHVLHLSTALMQHSKHQQAKEYVVQDKI